MAKQTGPVKLTGTIDGLCFYKMEGRYYVRRKSSLSTKRYQKDAAFSGSRRSSSRFGEGNRLASKVYQLIAEEKRVYSLFCFLKNRSILLLKEGNSLVEVKAELIAYLVDLELLEPIQPKVAPAQGIVLSKGCCGPNTRKPMGRVKTNAIHVKTAAVKQSCPLFISPLSRYVMPPAGRSALSFALKDGRPWRSPPRRGRPGTDCT
ncbi:MAG TPA: hypothetical protein VGN63_14490 [Flavisolibacter sp.]|jgi:hypothetical protein|nr:hypothetical protein [Flavisolibacter sp.]